MGDATLIPDFVQSLSMSKVCPISVQIIFFIQKLKMRTLITFSQVQSMSSICPVLKIAIFLIFLDIVWTISIFVCPSVLEVDISLTEF